jgi:RHS repeat-associated protein
VKYRTKGWHTADFVLKGWTMKRTGGLLRRRSLALGVAFLIAGAAVGRARADQILEVYGTSLTSYKPAATSVGQDVWPLHQQRGVNIDGTIRAGSSMGWALAGNPFSESWDGHIRLGDLRVDLGAYSPTDVDVALPAPGFRWVIGRSFNGQQSNGSHRDGNGYQGKNWFQMSQPEIVLYDADSNPATKEAADVLYIVYGADRFVEFKRTAANSNDFKGKNGTAGAVQYSSGSPDTYIYTDQAGSKVTFFGSNTGSNAANWQFWKMVDPAGNTAYAGDPTTAATAVTNGYNSDKSIKMVVDSADRRYTYTYSTIDSVSRLTQVKAETHTGGTWASSPTGVVEVARVDYDYYTGSSSNGDNGNLKLVTLTTPLTDSGKTDVRKKYYRYWVGAYNGSTNRGYANTIKLVLGYEGARKFDWDQEGTLDDDFLTATTADLKAYSDAYLEYDTSYRIDVAFFNGECGCSGGNNGQYSFAYAQKTTYATLVANASYDTDRASRTVMTRPDGSSASTFETRYFDETGQPLGTYISNTTPTGSPTKWWATDVVRNSDGQLTEIRTPANITAYTHDTTGNLDGAMTASSSVGLIWVFTRLASTDALGFPDYTQFKEAGTGATAQYQSRQEYTTLTMTVGGVTVARPVRTASTGYSTKTGSVGGLGASDKQIVTTSVTAHSGGGSLMVKVNTVTDNKVPTSTNGNGDGGGDPAIEGKQYRRADGTVAFSVRPAYSSAGTGDRIWRYTKFTNGQVVKVIEDAQTNNGSDFAAGDDPNTDFSVTENAAGSRVITTYTYDAQGRLDTTTLPDGRVMKMYYSLLADGRLVTMSCPRMVAGSPTYYGPMSYSVTNHAGRAEAQATVAITSAGITTVQTGWINESSSDPIAALTIGSMAHLSTSVYNKAGTRVEESRAYFLVPGSGAGSAGTNYDATTYAFDDMGHTWRTETAAGTVTRTRFDTLGRPYEQWVGTNDHDAGAFPGGDTAGTENMTKVSETEYDSGSRGNSYVTTRTLDPDGDWDNTGTAGHAADDRRITTYTNDIRGRVIVAANPLSPHVFSKFDNLGRLIATGTFSSTGSIVVASDDPTTETTNRLGLSQTFYDVKGQVWKSQVHKIDVTDGSDDDTLITLNWYDSQSRLMKTRGPGALAKTFYDRLGRATHRFTIAKVDESDSNTYGDADDVSGDIVLEEHQTTYETTTGNVLMQATISRLHDDLASGTTGALDTNADSDRMKFTSGNVAGRIQITAMMYDELDRLTAQVAHGTNGSGNVTTFDRTGWSVPSRSDTELVTSYSYNDDGTVLDVTDPRGKVTRTLYDAMGRTTATIANRVNDVPSGLTNDDDVYTRWTFANGLQTEMWVDIDGDGVQDGGVDQVTVYTYGTAKASNPDSRIATGHLLQKVTYPDSSSGSDVVKHAYNTQGQVVYTSDQAGTIHERDYDAAGKLIQDRATALGSGIDNAVLRVGTTFDSRGQVDKVTQFSTDSGTPADTSNVTDQLQYTYDDWGNITNFEQDPDSKIVSGSGRASFSVAHTYSKATPTGGRPVVRRATTVLPGSSTVTFNYSSTGNSLADVASRVSTLSISATTVASYAYLGSGLLVGQDLPECGADYRYYTGTGTYGNLDRFDRVTSSTWFMDASTVAFYDVNLSYDRDSNITSAEDTFQRDYGTGGNPQRFSAAYTMDNMNRLTRALEGHWNGSSISTTSRDQQWTLSQPDNQVRDKLDLNGDTDFVDTGEIDDTRTHNVVNELTGRDTDSNASDNYTLTYDAAGNQTDDGKAYTYVYDAWGRLRKVKNRLTPFALVGEYWYNGLGYRVAWKYDTDADSDVDGSDKKYWFCYDERWRSVATFRETDTDPKERFVFHAAGVDGRGGSSYIDSVALRDKDASTAWTAAADSIDERRYYCQNWRADVSAVINSDGSQVLEWIKTSAYGVPYRIEPADYTRDGSVTSADSTAYTADYNLGNPEADINFDGFVDGIDDDLFNNTWYANPGSGGKGVLSRASVGSRIGGSYQLAPELAGTKYHVRHRVLNAETGEWNTRDPAGYVDGVSVYAYAGNSPVVKQDSTGLRCPCGGGIGGGPITPPWQPCVDASSALYICLKCCVSGNPPTTDLVCASACFTKFKDYHYCFPEVSIPSPPTSPCPAGAEKFRDVRACPNGYVETELRCISCSPGCQNGPSDTIYIGSDGCTYTTKTCTN